MKKIAGNKNPKVPNKGDSVKKYPKLRFPEFIEEWVKKKLGEIAQIIGGGTPDTNIEEYWNGNIQWFTPTEIKSNYVSKSNRTITELGLKKSSAKLLPKGTLLLTTRATIGDVAIATEECTTNQGFQSLIVNEGFDNVFISNWIKLNKKELLIRAKGSTFPEIGKAELSEIKIFLPSLVEQRKLASFLSLLDDRISTQNKIIRQLETLMQGLSDRLFNQQLRFKDCNGNEYPERKKKLGSAVFKNISDKNHNSDLPILAITQEHGAIPREMIDYKITVTEKSVESYKVVQVGDFIISLRSFQGGIEYSNYKGICSPAYVILRAFIPINELYFKYYFKTRKYINELNKKLEGIRDGKMISYSYFSEVPLLLPSIEEQKRISSTLSLIDGKIKAEKKILEQYEAQKKYLLQNMLI